MGNCLHVDVTSKDAVGYEDTAAAVCESKASDASDAAALLTGSLAYTSWVELGIQCTRLRHADALSKSDPLAVLYEFKNGQWSEIGRTEMIANTYDPCFIKKFRINYNFEEVQRFSVVVVDIDKGQDPTCVPPTACQSLGSCEFVLGEAVTAPRKQLVRNLADRNGKTLQSTVVLLVEEESKCRDHYRMCFQAHNLKNAELVGKSDPFLQISRLQEDGMTWLPVYKTETRKSNLKPVWDEVRIRGIQLNNGDVDRVLRLQVYGYDDSGNHRLLGFRDTTTRELCSLASRAGALLELLPPPGKKQGGDFGALQVVSFHAEVRPTFLDYITGGLEVGFVVAVDFTASNGDPRVPTSNHYLAGGPNQYERAIMGVGEVLMQYDNDKEFPMLGFGGKRCGSPAQCPADHCFPIGQGPNGVCSGVDGLLWEYRRALHEWRLSGPTYFAQVLQKAASMAEECMTASGPPKYTCLLILTDGEVSDMAATIDGLIRVSHLPLSVLIVGVGSADFTKMKFLDGDQQRLCNGGNVAARDIVQFVEFNRFAFDGTRLAKELLAELPGQVVEYCAMRGILPPGMVPQLV